MGSKDDQATAERFRAALELPYPLVGNPTGEVLRGAYDVRIPVLGLGRARHLRDRPGSAHPGDPRRVHSNAESHVTFACQVVLRKPGA